MKIIKCRDAGFACNHVIRAKTESELMRMVADHAKTAHGLKKMDRETTSKLKSIIRDE